MNIKCIKCGNEINPLRVKALPNTRVCINCSTTGAYKAITTTEGKGDHTYNSIKILTSEQHEDYINNHPEIE
tara:strand:+ start:464 stop:679 length:216 start_codon:yes stop_codon:yes gene_type:complete